MRLPCFHGIACGSASGAQEVDFLLHLLVPSVFVVLADVHEHAQLRDRLESGGARLPHVAWKSRYGFEVLRMGCRDVERRDTSVGWSRNVERAVLDFVVLQEQLKKLR